MLAGDIAEGDRVAEGQAGVEEGIVRRAEELAAKVACGVESLDDLALFGGDAAKLVGQDARCDGGAADMTAGAPEGSVIELVQVLRGLAEVDVLALLAQLVVAVEGFNGLLDGQAELLRQFLDGVGAEGVDQFGEDTDMEAGILFLEVAGHDEVRHTRGGVRHVVAVIDLAIPAEGSGILVLGIHVLALEAGLPAKGVGDVGHVDFLIDEALAVHVDDQIGRLIPHQACVKVVHDAAVGHRLHAAAGLDGEDVAVAGAANDLLVELLDVRAEAADHGGVVLIGAGCEDDRLGVDLDVVAVEVLADAADDAAVVILEELDDRGIE